MKIIVFLSLCFSIAFMLGLDLVLWTENPMFGIGGVLGIIAYFIAYSISGDMIVAPRDYWRLSSWQVFRKKFGYGMSTYILVTFISAAILQVIFG